MQGIEFLFSWVAEFTVITILKENYIFHGQIIVYNIHTCIRFREQTFMHLMFFYILLLIPTFLSTESTPLFSVWDHLSSAFG